VAAMALAPLWLLAPAADPRHSRFASPGHRNLEPAARLGQPSSFTAPSERNLEYEPPSGPALVPVPTAASRARARGFDQAELLARGLAARGVGRLTPCLERIGDASRQRGSSRAERLADGRIELRIRPGARVPALCVLVDDVHTTGATFDACATALGAGGAKRVVALAYARALP
ncbi:MAG: ComF family protein, partial [Solirubrobacterales bacterium]|nr:ComF family protein [Solirubrobacterales bacterium]